MAEPDIVTVRVGGAGAPYSTVESFMTTYPNKDLEANDTIVKAKIGGVGPKQSTQITGVGWNTTDRNYLQFEPENPDGYAGATIDKQNKPYLYHTSQYGWLAEKYLKGLRFVGLQLISGGGIGFIRSTDGERSWEFERNHIRRENSPSDYALVWAVSSVVRIRLAGNIIDCNNLSAHNLYTGGSSVVQKCTNEIVHNTFVGATYTGGEGAVVLATRLNQGSVTVLANNYFESYATLALRHEFLTHASVSRFYGGNATNHLTDPICNYHGVQPGWVDGYGIGVGSPLVDKGIVIPEVWLPPLQLDIAGQPRISGDLPDIGAFEYQVGVAPSGPVHRVRTDAGWATTTRRLKTADGWKSLR